MSLDNGKGECQMEHDEIGELIKKEDDPKTRAILLVLQSINLSLRANTQAVNDNEKRLEIHIEEYAARTRDSDALLNKGKGGWYVLSAVLAITQGFIGWTLNSSLDEVKALHAADNVMATRITVLETK